MNLLSVVLNSMEHRIIEWLNNDQKKFHLEFKGLYDGEWHLRLFSSGMPCTFGTLQEAKDYAIDNPMVNDCVIHKL